MAKRVSGTQRSRTPKSGAAKPRVIGPFSILAEKLVILAAIAGGGALIYLIYGLLSGHIISFPNPPGGKTPLTEPAQAALIAWVGTATKVLSWAAVVGTVLALARYYDSSGTIALGGAIGAFLYFGVPALIAMLLQQQFGSANQLTDLIILGTRAGGKVILIVAAARGAVQVLLSVTRRPRRARIARVPGQAAAQSVRPRTLLRQCWELAGCRSSGGACPALRQRRSCWKRGSGCLCDLKLAEALAQGTEAWAHEEVTAVRYRAAQARRPCKVCPIYEEHQDYKFRILQWLAYPATAGLVFASFPVLHVGYEQGLKFMDHVVAALTFMPLRLQQAPVPGGVQSVVLSSDVEWVFFGCLGLLAVSYVLQGIERAIFKWGW